MVWNQPPVGARVIVPLDTLTQEVDGSAYCSCQSSNEEPLTAVAAKNALYCVGMLAPVAAVVMTWTEGSNRPLTRLAAGLKIGA